MKTSAGSLESSDCLITITDSDELVVVIESVVFDQFGKQIKKVILDTLKEHNISKMHVICLDKGALDYTIPSRLETALNRRGESLE